MACVSGQPDILRRWAWPPSSSAQGPPLRSGARSRLLPLRGRSVRSSPAPAGEGARSASRKADRFWPGGEGRPRRRAILRPMPVAPRVKPSELFSPEQWAPFRRRSAWVGPALVAHCWGVIALAVAVGARWPWTIPLGIMVVGTRQLGLAILMHEAAHGALSPNQKLNDFLGHWLCAVPVGASLKAYRPYHLNHHKYAQNPEDPDLV